MTDGDGNSTASGGNHQTAENIGGEDNKTIENAAGGSSKTTEDAANGDNKTSKGAEEKRESAEERESAE